jgi:hypothetical protein
MKYPVWIEEAEKKFTNLLLEKNLNLTESNHIKIWEVIKEFSQIRIHANINEPEQAGDLVAGGSCMFECSLLEKDNLYLFILSRRFSVSHCFGFGPSWSEYFQIIFSFYPLDEYANFKGQLYAFDFGSVKEFFHVLEEKKIFNAYMNGCKPVSIRCFSGKELITNF